MPRALRYQPEENMIHVVSTRCLQGMSFLRPNKRVNQIIAGVLCRALSRSKGEIALSAYVFMSNHYHLILRSKDVKSLSEFMQYFNQNLSRELSHIHEWKNHFWQTNYASHLVLDESALIDQFKYILSNSVKEGLVPHPQSWPGLHCYSHIVERKKVNGLWIDRSALYNARRSKNKGHLTEDDFSIWDQLKLERPECWSHLNEEEYRDMIKVWAKEISDEHRRLNFMGAKKVMEADVFQVRTPKVRDRPLCKSGCAQLRKAFMRAYYTFKEQYYFASCAYHNALFKDKLTLRHLYPRGGFIHGMVLT